MEQIKFDTGIREYRVGGGVMAFNPADPNLYARFLESVEKLKALEAGIPSEDVFMDHAGFSTYESIWRAKNVYGFNKILIVSQKYHLHRAKVLKNMHLSAEETKYKTESEIILVGCAEFYENSHRKGIYPPLYRLLRRIQAPVQPGQRHHGGDRRHRRPPVR